MNIVLPHTLLVMSYQIKKLGPQRVKKFVRDTFLDYRRGQFLLARSYHRHPMAQGMPNRIWRRHSALLTLMDERQRHKAS